MEKRRAWPRELYDELWRRWCLSEEFSSEPVFNQRIVKPATAQKSASELDTAVTAAVAVKGLNRFMIITYFDWGLLAALVHNVQFAGVFGDK